MKYYDERGNNVTEYVQDLEQKVRELQEKVDSFRMDKKVDPLEPEPIVTVEVVEEEKPKKKRKRSKK